MKHRIFNNISAIGWLPFVILSACICGCGNTATVSGKVNYQGRPVTYGSVIFVCTDKIARSGVIEPDGSYLIEGVPPGNVKIAVISRNPSLGRSVVRHEKPVQPGQKETSTQELAVKKWFSLPPKFENHKTSGLECTISSGRVSYDIDLK